MTAPSPMRAAAAASLLCALASAQIAPPMNCKLIAHVDKFPGAVQPKNNYAGVWGMVGNNGKEYAIVTARTGTIIYDCSNPSAPIERGFITGPTTGGTGYFWREANSFGDYVYCSSEHGSLQCINMTNPDVPVLASTFGGSAHTLSIDVGAKTLWASGGSYVGSRAHNLAASLTNPPQLSGFSSPYVHDCQPVRGYGYFAEINNGYFQIRDISNPSGTLPILSTTTTPGKFTHNVWTTDDDLLAVTADENSTTPPGGGSPQGSLAVYDISNKAAPVLLSQWSSPSVPPAVVHNVFIKGTVAHFSCYTDGYWAIDLSVPTAPKPICHYDTSTYAQTYYMGCWGCYPFQPSGVIYLSDMQSGFWIVEPTCGVPNLYGAGSAGKGGLVPTIDYSGSFAQVGNATFKIVGKQMVGGTTAALVLGVAPANVPVLGINLLVDLTQPNVVVTTSTGGTSGVAGSGSASVSVPIPNVPALALASLYAQYVVVDAASAGGVLAASRGMKFSICP